MRDMKKNALIVDDDRIVRIIHAALLLNAGYTVYEAENGEAAVQQFHSQQQFDIVLMDYNMPGMDGVSATREIRNLENNNTRVCIIGITADVSAETKLACIAAGMDEVIHKPVLPAAFAQLLQSLLASSPAQ